MKRSLFVSPPRRSILIAALLFFWWEALSARTIYLSPAGNDSADCAPGAVYRTLVRAAECLAPGDTLFVRNGTYTGGVWILIQATAEAPVLIRGESLEAVIYGSGSRVDAFRIDHTSHLTLDNLTIRNAARAGVSVLESDHVQIRRCRLRDNGSWGILTGFADEVIFEDNECYGSQKEHGIYHSNSGDRFIIRNNRIHDNNANGIHINGDPEMGGDGVNQYGIVEGNIIYGNGAGGGAGINMTHVQDVLVRNNLIYNNRAGGFTVYQDTGTFEQGSKRVVILGNTVYFRAAQGRSGVNIGTTSEKVLVAGNIFVSSGRRGTLEVNSDHLESIVSDYNILWGIDKSATVERNEASLDLDYWRSQTGNDKHSKVADPGFLAAGSGNFHLTDSSRAIDAGMPPDTVKVILKRLEGYEWILSQLDTLPESDLEGKTRKIGAAPDAGAFESGEPQSPDYDFNGDGNLNIADAIALILRSRGNPRDPALDLNGDGGFTIADVVELLLYLRGRL